MAFDRIEESELVGKGTTAQPDVPTIPAADQKRKFEEILRDVMIVHYNDFLDALEAGTASASIGAQTLADVDTNVQALLDTINFNGKTLATNITEDDTLVPTAGAVARFGFEAGLGDMLKAVYDTTDNGVVDNAEQLGGELPAYYAKQSDFGSNDISGIGDGTATGAILENNGDISDNADHLEYLKTSWDFTIATTSWLTETGGQYYTATLQAGVDITSLFPDVDHVDFSMITTGYADDDDEADSELFRKGYANVTFDSTDTKITFHATGEPGNTVVLQARL